MVRVDVVIVPHNHQLSALFGANVNLLLVFLVKPVLRTCIPYPSISEITPAVLWTAFRPTKMPLHSLNNPLGVILILVAVT